MSSSYGSALAPSEATLGRSPRGVCCCPIGRNLGGGRLLTTRETPVYLLLALLFGVSLYTAALVDGLLVPCMAALWCLCASSGILISSAGRGWPWKIFAIAAEGCAIFGLALGWSCRLTFPRVVIGSYVGPSGAALLFTGLAAGSFLVLAALLSHAVPELLGLRTVGSSAAAAERLGWGWHPEMVAHMEFGCQQERRPLHEAEETVSEQTVLRNLLDHRCYWSGEPAYDYAFHLANENSFISWMLCHPHSPFEKLERVVVLAIIIPLIIFPVAAFGVLMEHGLLRTLLQLLLITLPRNALKAYLHRLVIADDEIIVENSRGLSRWRRFSRDKVMEHADEAIASAAKESLQISRARWHEATFLAACSVVTAAFCAICGACVKRHGRSLALALADSSDGLAFAHVIELLLDLIMPHRGKDGSWSLGFFGRWWSERPHVAPARKPET